MDQAGPHRNLGIEVLLIAPVTGHERDDDVRVAALRADEGLGVGLAPVDLVQHLVGRVSASRAVTLHLPPASEILRRVEEHADVVLVAHRGGVEPQQALDDRELRRPDVLGRGKRPVLVAVHGLDNRVARTQVPEMLVQDVDVVAVRVQRGEPMLGALLAVVAVIVVGGDVRDLLLAENADKPARQRRLARCLNLRRCRAEWVEASGADRIAVVKAATTEKSRAAREEWLCDELRDYKIEVYEMTVNQ